MMHRPDTNISMGVLALKENKSKLGTGDWNEAVAAHHLGDQIVNNALQIMNLDQQSKKNYPCHDHPDQMATQLFL